MIKALSVDDNVMCDRIIWALECIGENARGYSYLFDLEGIWLITHRILHDHEPL
jgi:hypothetical protein